MDVDLTDISGLGRRIMRYRARVIGATLQIQSLLGVGTTISCVVGLSQQSQID